MEERKEEMAQRSVETSSLSLPRDRLTKDDIYIFPEPLIFSFIICQSPRPFLGAWCLPAANDPFTKHHGPARSFPYAVLIECVKISLGHQGQVSGL